MPNRRASMAACLPHRPPRRGPSRSALGLAMASTLALVACGGGGSGSSTSQSGGGGGGGSGSGGGGTFTTCAGANLPSAGGSLCVAASVNALALNGALYSVAYGNGLWVTVGSNGTIATSTDAANWTARTSGTASTLTGVAFANGLWVAVGGQPAAALYSSDGITWTSGSGVAATDVLGSVAYANGQWIATGSFNGAAATYSSADGKAWVRASSTLAFLDRSYPAESYAPEWATFGNGLWVGGSLQQGITSSADGVHWSEQVSNNVTNHPRAAAYGNGQWIEVGDAGAANSADALNWTAFAPSAAGNLMMFAVAYANAEWVIAGGNNGIVLTSATGSAWTTARTDTSGFTQQLFGVAYGNGRWVVVGGGGATAAGVILVSTGATL